MKFIIPSLSRQNLIVNKTLKLLVNEYNIDENSIYIFVIQEEFDEYTKTIKSLYPNINIIIGPLGLNNMRNFIHSYFPENTELVCIDDDIKDLKFLKINNEIKDIKSSKRYELQSFNRENFMKFLEDAFNNLYKNNATLFGIYPVKNGYFMKDLPEITYDLKFIVGAFWGCINKSYLNVFLEEKEDVERTLLAYTFDKCVIRYNHITLDTNYYKEKGGMQTRNEDRIETSKESCKYLLSSFPLYTSLYTSKKSGIYEIRLRDKLLNKLGN